MMTIFSTPVITGIGIDKHYGAFQVLHGVDFFANKGEAVGIVGPNGAGKTTLFGVLAGAAAPSSGSVIYQGEDITVINAAQRCHAGIARTHQVPRPFLGMTVFENLLTAAQNGAGLSGDDAEKYAVHALQQADIAHLANRPTSALGLLDRKRLELARALATAPKVLLLDEIGGGLTEGELHQLIALISELKADGLTIIWIEHILHALLKVIDRLVCMSEGRVIAEGAPSDVMNNPDVMKAYLGSELEKVL